MKRLETTAKVIGENTFYIRPFGAFTAANISGELTAVLSPILAGIAPLIGSMDLDETEGESTEPMDMDIEKAMPAISSALSTISGDKIERMVRQLLVDHRNVSVVSEDTGGQPVQLSADLADEVFCGDIQDMFLLCITVIKINFKGFFKNVGTRSGSLIDKLTKGTPTSANGETSTTAGSATSN